MGVEMARSIGSLSRVSKRGAVEHVRRKVTSFNADRGGARVLSPRLTAAEFVEAAIQNQAIFRARDGPVRPGRYRCIRIDQRSNRIGCGANPGEYEMAVEAKKVLLVSLEQEDQVIDCLRRANCVVMKANDGESALAFAKHVAVDAFVLISIGGAMGRTETALNLRDICPFSEIIFVARNRDQPTPGEAAAKAIPHTRVLARQELRSYLAPSEG